jgi:hypothetical protein
MDRQQFVVQLKKPFDDGQLQDFRGYEDNRSRQKMVGTEQIGPKGLGGLQYDDGCRNRAKD